MFNPILAVSITSASRLLLSTTEALLERHGTTHAYCDTDSMFVPPKYTKEIQEFFSGLNPYNFEADIFKLEMSNIWFYGLSAKRYCLYSKNGDKITIGDDDYSAHGLGHLLDPFKSRPDEHSLWHKYIWQDILELHYGVTSRGDLIEKYENKYAMQQLSISTPNLYSRFSKINKGKDFYHQIKSGNFAIVGFPSDIDKDVTIKPFAPYKNPAKLAVTEAFVDYNDPKQTMYCGSHYWQSFWNMFERYRDNKESKFDGEIGVLQRKHVSVSSITHIGKESNTLETELDKTSYNIYENYDALEEKFRELAPKILALKPKDVKEFGISKQTLWNVKNKIKKSLFDGISNKTKLQLLKLLSHA